MNVAFQSGRITSDITRFGTDTKGGVSFTFVTSRPVIKDCQVQKGENGYTETNVNGEGSAVWFRKMTPDKDTKIHRRLCVDILTSSATVFWPAPSGKVSSKTFRTVSSLKAWFVLTSEGQPG